VGGFFLAKKILKTQQKKKPPLKANWGFFFFGFFWLLWGPQTGCPLFLGSLNFQRKKKKNFEKWAPREAPPRGKGALNPPVFFLKKGCSNFPPQIGKNPLKNWGPIGKKKKKRVGIPKEGKIKPKAKTFFGGPFFFWVGGPPFPRKILIKKGRPEVFFWGGLFWGGKKIRKMFFSPKSKKPLFFFGEKKVFFFQRGSKKIFWAPPP